MLLNKDMFKYMANNVNKRVLTLKSRLGFGKYANNTIQEIVNLGKNQYLRWVYYNYEHIDYIEEILNIIYITDEYRIIKPAKNVELLKIVDSLTIDKEKHRFHKISNDESKKAKERVNNTFKFKKIVENSSYSLLLKNHGH